MASTLATDRPVALAACGLAAPMVFTAAVVSASIRYPGYSHAKNFISELGATGAPGAAIMNFAGFLAYGVLIVAFALAIHRSIRPDIGGWLGPAMLGLYGLAYVGVAMAPCDPGCQSPAPSLHHQLHILLGDLIVLTAVLGPCTLYSRMRQDPAWRSLALATLLLPWAAWVIVEASGVGVSGAIRQRLWLLLLFLWIELMALRAIALGRNNLRGSREAAA